MDIGQAVFSFISTPDVAYLLLILGLFSLVIAIGVPGTGLAEAAAAICLVLSIFGLAGLPVNLSGIILIITGVALFIVDLKVQSVLLAIGGAALVGVGSLFLFQPTEQTVRVSLWLITLVSIGSVFLFGYGVQLVRRAMRIAPKIDAASLVGARGTLKTALAGGPDATATAQIGGELWTVKSEQPIAAGEAVEVERVEGLVLIVGRAAAVE